MKPDPNAFYLGVAISRLVLDLDKAASKQMERGNISAQADLVKLSRRGAEIVRSIADDALKGKPCD